jgi:hypothetical protein
VEIHSGGQQFKVISGKAGGAAEGRRDATGLERSARTEMLKSTRFTSSRAAHPFGSLTSQVTRSAFYWKLLSDVNELFGPKLNPTTKRSGEVVEKRREPRVLAVTGYVVGRTNAKCP